MPFGPFAGLLVREAGVAATVSSVGVFISMYMANPISPMNTTPPPAAPAIRPMETELSEVESLEVAVPVIDLLSVVKTEAAAVVVTVLVEDCALVVVVIVAAVVVDV